MTNAKHFDRINKLSQDRGPVSYTHLPESYDATKAVLEKLGYTMEDVKNRNVVGISKKVSDYKALACLLYTSVLTGEFM